MSVLVNSTLLPTFGPNFSQGSPLPILDLGPAQHGLLPTFGLDSDMRDASEAKEYFYSPDSDFSLDEAAKEIYCPNSKGTPSLQLYS